MVFKHRLFENANRRQAARTHTSGEGQAHKRWVRRIAGRDAYSLLASDRAVAWVTMMTVSLCVDVLSVDDTTVLFTYVSSLESNVTTSPKEQKSTHPVSRQPSIVFPA